MTSKTGISKIVVVAVLSACLHFAATPALAERTMMMGQTIILPDALIFPNHVGILFPAFTTAAGIDAAALPYSGKSTDVNVAYGPSIASGDATNYFGGVASGTDRFGFGLGYAGSQTGGALTNGGFAGAGVDLKTVSLGMGLRDPAITGSFMPDVDLSILYGGKKGFTAGVVAYDVGNTKQFDVGIGYAMEKEFNIEVNCLLPQLSSIGQSGADYIFLLSLGSNPGIFAFNLTTSYDMLLNTFTATVGAGVWLTKHINILAQITSPTTVNVGVNYQF
jgi:hypothetical protein